MGWGAMTLAHAPFVLLDDARPGGAPARLYADPVRILAAHDPADIPALLAALREAGAQGLHAAGFLSYEAAPAFEARIAPRPAPQPLAWFGLFADARPVEDVAALLPDPAGAWIGAPVPEIDAAAYAERFGDVQALIRAGDLYQANLSFRAVAPIAGDPLALYAGLRARARAGWGAVVHTGDTVLLSLSPELFFARDGRRLTCRPMKGTARVVDDPAADRAAADALAADPKQRAENLMIVDLMRNDLSRVAVPGSVSVPDLFTVERYPTVHQMVSTVTAELAPGRDTLDVLAALFPCGSITGAPKIRAMQAIGEMEASARGAYTGAIGHVAPDGDAAFSVAIRTLVLNGDRATIGLGSGVVADSDVVAEWDECLAKAAFLRPAHPPFDLIETMAFDPMEGLLHLERHLSRMKASATALGFAFDRHDARNELQAATFRLRAPSRVRLLLAASGAIAIECSALPPPLAEPLRAAVVPLPVAPGDLRLRHKTTDRAFYDAARIAAGTDEVIFEAPDGSLTEGSFTSLFVEQGGRLVTPPLAAGLLPGILRAELVDSGRAVEGRLTRNDIAQGAWLGNALRGLMRATVAD